MENYAKGPALIGCKRWGRFAEVPWRIRGGSADIEGQAKVVREVAMLPRQTFPSDLT